MQSSWLVWVGTLPPLSSSVISRPTKWMSSRSNKVVVNLLWTFHTASGARSGVEILGTFLFSFFSFRGHRVLAWCGCTVRQVRPEVQMSCQGPLELFPHQYLPVLHKGNVLVLCRRSGPYYDSTARWPTYTES